MDIIVVGCGRMGAELAHRLYQEGHKVVVIDQSEVAFHNLPSDFRGRTVVGQALDRQVLHQAGIESADGLAAVTNSDTSNAVVAHLAICTYQVPNVVVRNYDSRWRALHEIFGLQVVSSSSWGAQRVEEILYHPETRTVFSAGNGEVKLYEFTIPDEWDERQLADLLPGEDCTLAALTRAGRASLPDCSVTLKRGDIILVSATLESSDKLRRKLKQANAEEG